LSIGIRPPVSANISDQAPPTRPAALLCVVPCAPVGAVRSGARRRPGWPVQPDPCRRPARRMPRGPAL